jgi:hypothetical protein
MEEFKMPNKKGCMIAMDICGPIKIYGKKIFIMAAIVILSQKVWAEIGAKTPNSKTAFNMWLNVRNKQVEIKSVLTD